MAAPEARVSGGGPRAGAGEPRAGVRGLRDNRRPGDGVRLPCARAAREDPERVAVEPRSVHWIGVQSHDAGIGAPGARRVQRRPGHVGGLGAVPAAGRAVRDRLRARDRGAHPDARGHPPGGPDRRGAQGGGTGPRPVRRGHGAAPQKPLLPEDRREAVPDGGGTRGAGADPGRHQGRPAESSCLCPVRAVAAGPRGLRAGPRPVGPTPGAAVRVLYHLPYPGGLGADRWIGEGWREGFRVLGHEFSLLTAGAGLSQRAGATNADLFMTAVNLLDLERERAALRSLRDRGLQVLLWVHWPLEARI